MHYLLKIAGKKSLASRCFSSIGGWGFTFDSHHFIVRTIYSTGYNKTKLIVTDTIKVPIKSHILLLSHLLFQNSGFFVSEGATSLFLWAQGTATPLTIWV